MEEKKIGVINEVGDLGLGFDPLSESETQKLKDKEKNKEEK